MDVEKILKDQLRALLGISQKESKAIMEALDEVAGKEKQDLTRQIKAKQWSKAKSTLTKLLRATLSKKFAGKLITKLGKFGAAKLAVKLTTKFAGGAVVAVVLRLINVFINLAKSEPGPKPPKPPKPPPKPAAKKHVYWSKLRYGQRDSDSVRALQRELNARGAKLPITGNYLAKTKAAVAAFQRRQGWTGTGADGLIYPGGKQTTKRLFPASKYVIHW